MTRTGVGLAVVTLGQGLAAVRPAGADIWRPLEVWRIESGRVAPWVPPGTRVDSAYRGREVRFQTTGITAPQPLACEGATYEWIVLGPEALFEGMGVHARHRRAQAHVPVRRLRASLARYMAAPQPPDEAPAINGDPFTTRRSIRTASPWAPRARPRAARSCRCTSPTASRSAASTTCWSAKAGAWSSTVWSTNAGNRCERCWPKAAPSVADLPA